MWSNNSSIILVYFWLTHWKQKYRNLAIFTPFFFAHFWLLKTSKITSFVTFEFWISIFGDVSPIKILKKRLRVWFDVQTHSPARSRSQTELLTEERDWKLRRSSGRRREREEQCWNSSWSLLEEVCFSGPGRSWPTLWSVLWWTSSSGNQSLAPLLLQPHPISFFSRWVPR